MLSSARQHGVWALAAAAMALAGCIQLEQTLLLNGDGSLAVRYHYSVAADSESLLSSGAETIRGWQGQAAGTPAWFTSEAAVRRHFAATGVTLQRYSSTVSGGRRHVDIQLFAEGGVAVLNAGVLGPLRCDRRADGRLRLWAELPRVPAQATGLDAKSLAALCQDLYLRLDLNVPGEIVETTASKRQRSTAGWEFDPGRDASFLHSPPRIECVFEAKRLEWAAGVPAAAP
jgi:hypothetical protein